MTKYIIEVDIDDHGDKFDLTLILPLMGNPSKYAALAANILVSAVQCGEICCARHAVEMFKDALQEAVNDDNVLVPTELVTLQ